MIPQGAEKAYNQHSHGDAYSIAASPSFRSRACCWRYGYLRKEQHANKEL